MQSSIVLLGIANFTKFLYIGTLKWKELTWEGGVILQVTCSDVRLILILFRAGSVEVNLPVDRFTKKIKGFALIRFSPPENAVKALADLDGSIFQVCYLDCL